jgi:hypothetical protein
MHAVTLSAAPIGKVLAILSVAFFYVLPIAPLIAIAALLATHDGWQRKTAVAGALLTTALTLVMAISLLWGVITQGLV